MKVSEIGEFGLIGRLAAEFGLEYPAQPGARPRVGLLVDIGDDALVTTRLNGATVWTTDTMVANVHFLPGQTSWQATGWKALAVNVSDIAAMGATPHLALITLALPPDFEVEDVLELYRGLHACASEYGVLIAGGDVVRSPVFSVTVALSGLAYTTDMGVPAALTRSAARAGDLVAVSGNLGSSAGGLRVLLGRADDIGDAGLRLVAAHERPSPRVALGQAAMAAGIRCGMDVSDGLVQDLGHIARASGVAIRVDASSLPLSEDLHSVFPEDALQLALTGGEDYELVLIGARAALSRIASRATGLTVIGEVLAGDPAVSVQGEDAEIAVPVSGWDHFQRPARPAGR